MRLTEIVDIGANLVDGPPPYQAMLAAGLCRVTGFEPNALAMADLQAAAGPNERYFPDAIGDGREHTLNSYLFAGLTSLLTLNPAAAGLFTAFDGNRLLAEFQLTTRRLDDLALPMDLLKIDVQGAELMIFQNAAESLASCVAVHTEVSVFPLYLDQPTHGDIDAELRRQIVDADWLYLRDYTRPEAMSDEQLWHLAAICHHIYDAFDIARLCLSALRARGVDPGWQA